MRADREQTCSSHSLTLPCYYWLLVNQVTSFSTYFANSLALIINFFFIKTHTSKTFS